MEQVQVVFVPLLGVWPQYEADPGGFLSSGQAYVSAILLSGAVPWQSTLLVRLRLFLSLNRSSLDPQVESGAQGGLRTFVVLHGSGTKAWNRESNKNSVNSSSLRILVDNLPPSQYIQQPQP